MNHPLPVTSQWNLNFIYDYYSWLLCAMIQPWPWETWREKGLLHLTGQSPSLREAKLGTSAGTWIQEIKQRPWRNTTYWINKLPFFLIYTRPTHAGITLSTGFWALTHQSTIKKIPYRRTNRPIWCDVMNSDKYCISKIITERKQEISDIMESEGTYQHKNLIKNRGWGRYFMVLPLDKKLQAINNSWERGN